MESHDIEDNLFRQDAVVMLRGLHEAQTQYLPIRSRLSRHCDVLEMICSQDCDLAKLHSDIERVEKSSNNYQLAILIFPDAVRTSPRVMRGLGRKVRVTICFVPVDLDFDIGAAEMPLVKELGQFRGLNLVCTNQQRRGIRSLKRARHFACSRVFRWRRGTDGEIPPQIHLIESTLAEAFLDYVPIM